MNHIYRALSVWLLAIFLFFKEGKIDLFPIRKSVKGYNLTFAKYDLKAATDVALVGLPQGIAFAALAGLPIVFGIMCATLGTIIAPLFTRSRLTVAGPSNATAFMLASYFLAQPSISTLEKIQIVPVIVFFVGIICLICSFVKATELLQFVSKSVLIGYICGAALLIIISQIKPILGLEFILNDYFKQTQGGRSFSSLLEGIITHVQYLQWQPLTLGLLTLGLYFSLRKKFKALPTFAIVLILMSSINALLASSWVNNFFSSVICLSEFTILDLNVTPPNIFSPHIFNQLYNIAPVIIGIAFLCILEQALMTKNLASKTGEKVNLNQDTFAVGITNTALSFCSSMPSSASLTRSILNYTSGAASRFASIYCGIICLIITLALAYLPLTAYIPASVLAALIVGNAISLFDRKALRICLRSTRADAIVLIITFLSALLVPLHTAIFIGAGISIMFFLRQAAKPDLIEYAMSEKGELKELNHKNERTLPAISIVHVEGNLFFGAAEVFRGQVQNMAEDPSIKIIILRLKNAHNLDATSVWALDELITYTREHDSHLLVSGASKEVYRILRHSGVIKNLEQGCPKNKRNIFLYSPRNPNYSTRLALIRAQELLGTKDADIRIFIDPKPAPAKSS